MIDVSPLFTPFDLDGLALANRIVMAPMTRSRSLKFTPGARRRGPLSPPGRRRRGTDHHRGFCQLKRTTAVPPW